MPFITQTTKGRIDLADHSFLVVLEMSNIAPGTVRAAGLESADICMCPAVKLARNVKIMESNRIPVPEQITTPRPAKTAKDLPNELISKCLQATIPLIHEDLTHQSEEYPYGCFQDALHRRLLLLMKALGTFGVNNQFWKDLIHGFFKLTATDKAYVKNMHEIFRASSDCRHVRLDAFLSWDLPLLRSYLEVHDHLYNDRLYTLAVDGYVDSLTLEIEIGGWYNDISMQEGLAAKESLLGGFHDDKLQLLLGQLPRFKRMSLTITSSGEPVEVTDAHHTTTEVERILLGVSRLEQLLEVFPGLDNLVVTIASEDATPNLWDVVLKFVSILRLLPIRRKTATLGFSDSHVESDDFLEANDVDFARALLQNQGLGLVMSG